MQFCTLPGLIGQRVFKHLDYKRNNCIDLDEFLCGINMYCRESKNKLYEILFDIYDLDNDGFIDIKEL